MDNTLKITRMPYNVGIEEGKSCDSPVADQYELGRSLGVTGTPSMITQDGALIPGYLPAEELARRLNVL